MKQQKLCGPARFTTGVRLLHLSSFFCLALCVMGGPAHATHLLPLPADSQAAGAMPAFKNSLPPPVQADPCLPLLHAIRYNNPDNSLDGNRRAAGSMKPPGIVMGLRFALGPDNVIKKRSSHRASLNLWTPETGTRTTNDVVAYEQCQQQKAFKAISEWRWTR